MVELWVPITVAAAIFQTLRTALQKQINVDLSVHATTFTRYVYGFPLALLYVAGLTTLGGLDTPSPNHAFLIYCVIGGIAQIGATSALIAAFAQRGFGIGTAYSKTDTIQAAVFGVIILGEVVSFGGSAAIFISLTGVVFLSAAVSGTGAIGFIKALGSRGAWLGLLAGALFGVSGVVIRAAALSLDEGHFLMRAALTLAVMTILQTALLAAYLYMRERDQLVGALASWRRSGLVGVLGILGSIGWFTAMTLQNAAYVRTLGQVELVFAFLVSHFYFRERVKPMELVGVTLLVGGILLLLNVR